MRFSPAMRELFGLAQQHDRTANDDERRAISMRMGQLLGAGHIDEYRRRVEMLIAENPTHPGPASAVVCALALEVAATTDPAALIGHPLEPEELMACLLSESEVVSEETTAAGGVGDERIARLAALLRAAARAAERDTDSRMYVLGALLAEGAVSADGGDLASALFFLALTGAPERSEAEASAAEVATWRLIGAMRRFAHRAFGPQAIEAARKEAETCAATPRPQRKMPKKPERQALN